MWNSRRPSGDESENHHGNHAPSEGDEQSAVSALTSFARNGHGNPPYPPPPPPAGYHPHDPYGPYGHYPPPHYLSEADYHRHMQAHGPPPPYWGPDYAPRPPAAVPAAAKDRPSGYPAVSATTAPPPRPMEAPSSRPAAPVGAPPRGKPEAMAKSLAAAQIEAKKQELEEEAAAEAMVDDKGDVGGVLATVATPAPVPPKKKRPPSKKPKRSTQPTAVQALPRTELLLHEKAPPVSDAEYDNLSALMVQFCRVPLLAEFSRPVSLLHPELIVAYKKIVSHPVDLGHVCRGIRRRQYHSLRDVRLDMWRVFGNCVKFHSHPHNKEAVPSFVSIALHLREYFNILWQEYMLPSDVAAGASALVRQAMAKRDEDRKKRIDSSGILVMSKKFTLKTAAMLGSFIEAGGCVDKLDTEPLLGNDMATEDKDLAAVVQNLKQFKVRLDELAENSDEYSLDEFYRDLRQCYTVDVFEENKALQNRVGNRLLRFFWKRSIPLHEANSRGVTQSSIWGNVAATIWARESSKKPYWPALCLGILPPTDQREGWHAAVTERNEARLPEKLRTQLLTAKRKCEQAQKRQNLSYFLVEFLGTHEFIWVRETDIIEKFDPQDDPNKEQVAVNNKRKRASRSQTSTVTTSKTYAAALEECTWASEEYESVLQDAFDDDASDREEDGAEEEMNYSFNVLAQSDDEADEEDEHGFHYDEEAMSDSDTEEANWLLAHDGMIDTSTKKKTKKRPPSAKKEATPTPKKSKSPAPKSDHREVKKDSREVERRRKRRTRELEKALKDEVRKKKGRRGPSIDSEDDDRGLARDKRARATAIVKAYLTRTENKVDDYKSLALNGVMTIPSAMVDPTGLLGMALAFRAAAGELNMPDDSEEQITKATKPWAAIDTTGPKTSAERCLNLEKQIELLEQEIERVRSNTLKRKALTEEAIAQRQARDLEIAADDVAARTNHFKKKKKMSPKPKEPGKAETDKGENGGAAPDDDAPVARPAELADDGEQEATEVMAEPEDAASVTDEPMPDAEAEPVHTAAKTPVE